MIFCEIPEHYCDFRASTNNDKTGYKQHSKILVKTYCFDEAGLEVVHIIVKHMCFENCNGPVPAEPPEAKLPFPGEYMICRRPVFLSINLWTRRSRAGLRQKFHF